MKRLLLLALSVLFALNIHAQDYRNRELTPEEIAAIKRLDEFALLTGCQPVYLIVEELHQAAAQIGLTGNSIETLARSRLRAARIYSPNRFSDFTLYVNLITTMHAISISVEFKKYLYDPFTERNGNAVTWDSRNAGTHGGSGGFIRQAISEHIDKFIDEYLRVNADYCK